MCSITAVHILAASKVEMEVTSNVAVGNKASSEQGLVLDVDDAREDVRVDAGE